MSPSDERLVEAEAVRELLERGACVLVDVREHDEHARERIAGAHHAPLSTLTPDDLPEHSGDRPLVVYCASGARSRDAAARLAAMGIGPVHELRGGLQAWKGAKLETAFDARAPMPIMRQVQIVAGSLVVLGVVLGALVSPWLYGLSAFVGAGLVFAGVSGICGMARLLQIMPWNRRHDARKAPAGKSGSDMGARAA